MPAPQPLPETGVIGQLLAEGYRFNFFQAVRLLTLCEPHRAPVGHDSSPRQEVVRFGAHTSMEFPASQIDEIVRHGDPDRPPQMAVNFFGLTTPISGLPQHYTEIVLERLARKDRALLEFLNLFNHRLLSLFYRAWEKYHFWIAAEHALLRERTALSAGGETLHNFVVNERPQLDPLGQVLLSLVGLGNPAARYVMSERDHLESRTGIADQTWRFYAGLLSQRHRSAIGLESLLGDHFGWPVRVQALVGRWLHLEAADRTRLKRLGNTQLGRETVAGHKVWEVQGKFRLRIGPLGYEQFCSLLPIGDAHEPLTQLTRFYAGQHLDFDLELLLHAAEIPPLRCGDRTGIGARLGWNTWLPAGRRSHQTASVILRTAGEQSE